MLCVHLSLPLCSRVCQEPTMEDTFQMEDSSTFREPPFSSGKEEKDPKEGKFRPPGTGTPALPEGVAWGALVLGFLRLRAAGTTLRQSW